MLATMGAAIRLVHPAPALAVTVLSAALAAILAAEQGPIPWPVVALMTLSVAGSQVFTGATNDLADQERDALLRPEKPLIARHLSANLAVWIAAAGLAVQLATAWRLGTLPLVLGAVASASALAYNLWLSRTPLSFVPYVVSFGILPFWIAAALGIPLERVAPTILLVAPFAVAAHLANTLRDFGADATVGSRCLAQVLGERRARWVAAGLAITVALAVAATLLLADQLRPASVASGVLGLAAVIGGAARPRLLWPGMMAAAVLWTIAWGLSSG